MTVRFPAGPDPDRPEKSFAVTARRGDGRRAVLDVVGEMDASTAPLLQACVLTQLSRPGLRELVLDMGGVEFLGAAGVSVVAEARKRSRERGVRFRLRSHGRPQVVAPLRLTGVIGDLRAASPAEEARKRGAARTPVRRRSAIHGSSLPAAPQPCP